MSRLPAACARTIMAALLLTALAVAGRAAPAFAAAPISLDTLPKTDDFEFIPADVLVDPNGRLSIGDVSRGRAKNAFRPASTYDRENLREDAGWMRFSIRAGAALPSDWLLIAPQNWDQADLYVPRSDGAFSVLRFGIRVPFARRPYRMAQNLIVQLTPQIASGRPLYLRFARSFPNGVGVAIENRNASLAHGRVVTSTLFFLIGALTIILLTNLFLFLYLKDVQFLAFTGVIATQIFDILVSSRSAWQYLWPTASVSVGPIDTIDAILAQAALVAFTRSFLSTRSRQPLLDRILLATVAVASADALFWQFAPEIPSFMGLVDDALAILVWLPVLLAGGFALYRGFLPARFFLIGSVAAFTGSAFQIFGPPDTVITVVAPDIGTICEGLFLTFAIADRLVTANRSAAKAATEREEALRAAIEAEEQHVSELEAQNRGFARFVPRAFLEALGKESVQTLQLGDQTQRNMAILFSDIRSFTALSESMTPQETFDFLNSYLRRVGPIVREHGGFIDKYIGDAIMGLLPDPHAALDAAIALQHGVRTYNEDRARSGYAPITVGVGLHYGPLMMGTIGEAERFETTVISDAVNVASRLESLTKSFRARILASASIVDANGGDAGRLVRFLGAVHLRGMARATEVYEICDGDPPDEFAAKAHSVEAFHAGVEAFRRGDRHKAARIFEEIVASSPLDGPAAYFAERTRSSSSESDDEIVGAQLS